MNLEQLVRENVKALSPYSTARDDFKGQADVYLDANESPFETGLNRYPDPKQAYLRTAWANYRRVAPEQVIAGNGSDEIIDLMIRAFCEPGVDSIVVCPPTYSLYGTYAAINGVHVVEVPLLADFAVDVSAMIREEAKLLFLCSPNNPTGTVVPEEDLRIICGGFKGIVVLDEAYVDFSVSGSAASLISEFDNLFIMQTLSKAFGLASIRVGFGLGSAQLIEILDRIKPPYNLNGWSQRVAAQAIEQSGQMESWKEAVLAQREVVASALSGNPMVEEVYPTETNFLLVRFKDASEVYRKLMEAGVVVRDRSNLPGCEGCLRITIGTMEENVKLLETLSNQES